MKTFTPKFRLVAVDHTEFWREDIQAAAGRIIEYFLFDETEQTFLCGLTPSAFLHGVGFVTAKEVSEDIEEDIRQEAAESCYVGYEEAAAMTYVLLPELAVTDEEWAEKVEEYDGDSDWAYEELIDELIEYLQGNTPEGEVTEAMGYTLTSQGYVLLVS